ncbi:hypothetical protein DTO164E3_6771 [Paecilomyces variotii]|nr:hypothetical protein DTO164E3_6771 [Paecilomyces variotii]KAJ9283173.1 hypothetical protein DTO021C3_9247 [Paecilomyces variotii]
MDKHLHKVIVLFRTESDRHGYRVCFDTSTLQIARRCDCWSASETSLRSESNRQLYSYIPSPLTPRQPIQVFDFLLLLYQDVQNHPALLLLLTLAAHPNLTLDYNRMSVMSRMLPEDMWTTSDEVAVNIRALVQLAEMIRGADSMTVDDLEHIELEQARVQSLTGAGYGQNGPNQVLQPHTTPGPAEPLFDHDRETSHPGPAYRVDGTEYNGDDDDDDDRTSVASWISGRVWIPSELEQNDDHTYSLSAGAGDSDEDISSSQWSASNTERDERLLRSPSMPYSVAAEYDTRSEQFTDSFEIEREATHVNPDQNGRDSAFWPSLNMILDERPLSSLSSSSSSSSSVPCSDTVESCSEQFMNPEEQSQWRTPSRAREYNHGDQPAVPPWVITSAISGGYRLPPLFMPFTDTVHGSEEFDFDVISDAASVCSIGGGVWMGD